MELWNHYTSSVYSPDQFRGVKNINVVLACYMLCTISVKAQNCGPCQKKFVWTTAWPMEENYVTYKLIGPLIDKSQIGQTLSLGSSLPNQTNPLPSQQNYFLFLSTPKGGEEDDKSVPTITETAEHLERIGLKTEVELNELPSKLDINNYENQAHNRIISLANPSYFGNISRPDYGNKNIPLSQRVVFSAHRSDATPKEHTLELESKVRKSSYVKANGNAKSHQSPSNITSKVVNKLQKKTINFPELISKAKSMVHSSDKLHKVRRVPYDPTYRTGKGIIQRHRAVSKKILSKSKSLESAQSPKGAKNATLNSELFPNKDQPLKKTHIENPSNILKIVKMDTGLLNNPLPTNVSSDWMDMDLSNSLLLKENMRFPTFRDANSSSISRFPTIPHNVRCKVPLHNSIKGVETTKEKKPEVIMAPTEKATEVNIVKSALKSSNVHKKKFGQREKQPYTGEKITKKRREYPYTKELEETYLQHTSEVMQPRLRKILPLRYRPHSMTKLSGVAADNNTSFLA